MIEIAVGRFADGGVNYRDSVANVVAVIGGKAEVLDREGVDCGIEFEDGDIDTVVQEGGRSGPDTEADVEGFELCGWS